MRIVNTLAASLLSLTLSSLATAQAVALVGSTSIVTIDSGLVANNNPSPAAIGIPSVVWSTVVSVPTSSWLRLRYAGILLSGNREPGGNGSFVRITSLLDNQFQTQHLLHVEQWRQTSAYFNGDSVLVELLACPGTGHNRLMIDEVTAGPASPVSTDEICGPTDDRVLSNDPRVARLVPVGCTGWLINDCNHCFLTAGHCTGSSMQVAEFNVPLSTGSGSLQHPGPQHQYAIDFSSVQTNGGLGTGNDWAYYGVFPNSTTGQTPFQANGGLVYNLVSTPPPVGNQSIRITGYGIVSSPVSPTWEQVQKTHAGPYVLFQGTTVEYTTDTTGGNSGSPVLLDGTTTAIGIHTHGGCTASSGSNLGTAGNHNGLQTALSSPTGICYCAPVSFTYPNGLPNSVSPAGITALRVQIGGLSTVPSGNVNFHMSSGGPFTTIAPTALGNDLYEVIVPPLNCQSTLTYYWSATDTTNTTYYDPQGAPTSVHMATVATNLATIRNYNFNTMPAGWVVQDTNVSGGSWTRGAPQDPWGPYQDYDGSGQCWVTGNGSSDDVDGGPTRLRTETIDVSTATNPIVRYAAWFACSTGEDRLIVEASQDNGANWTAIEVLQPFSGWQVHGFRVLDHFVTPGQLIVRFSVSDNPNNSTTEAALDAFAVEDATCPPPTWNAFGSGCAPVGTAPSLTLISLPSLGGVFVLQTLNLGAGAPFMITGFSTQTPPVALAPFGFGAGCTLYVTPDAVFFLPGGLLGFPIPNDPAFSGVRFYNQVIELGPVPLVSDAGAAEIR